MVRYVSVNNLRTRKQLIWRLIWTMFFNILLFVLFIFAIHNLFNPSISDIKSDNIILSIIIILVSFVFFGFGLLEDIEIIKRLKKKDYWIKSPYK